LPPLLARVAPHGEGASISHAEEARRQQRAVVLEDALTIGLSSQQAEVGTMWLAFMLVALGILYATGHMVLR